MVKTHEAMLREPSPESRQREITAVAAQKDWRECRDEGAPRRCWAIRSKTAALAASAASRRLSTALVEPFDHA